MFRLCLSPFFLFSPRLHFRLCCPRFCLTKRSRFRVPQKERKEPGDRLSQVLQHLDADHVKGSLAELVSEEGPIHEPQIDLFKLLGTDMDELNLSVIAWHFRDSLMVSDAVDEARASILFIAANVWVILELVYFDFPWALVRLGDSRLSVRNKIHLAALFFFANS